MTGMPASLAFLSAGRIGLGVLREQDQDLGALRDHGVDVGQLLLVAEVGVGIDVRAAAGLDGLLDVRLVVRRPARLLEVVPRHADGAARRRGTAGRRCAAAPLAAALPARCSMPAARTGGRRRSWRPPGQQAYGLPTRHRCSYLLGLRCDSVAPDRWLSRVRLHAPSDASHPPGALVTRVIEPARARDVPWLTRSPARAVRSRGASQAGRIGQQRLEGQLGRAEQRGIDAERRGHDPDERRGARAGRADRARASTTLADERVDPGEQAAEHDQPRIEDVDEAGQADAEPAPDVLERRRAPRPTRPRRRARTASTSARPPSAGWPARRRSASSPISVSQQPTEPQRQVAPSGLTGMWPTSPP